MASKKGSFSNQIIQPVRFGLPPGLVDSNQAFPTVFIDTRSVDLRGPDRSTVEKINAAIFDALCSVCPEPVTGQGLLKVHVGEPACLTRMKPEYVRGSGEFLRHKGASGVVAGDTTVAYSGLRGHRQNPLGAAGPYQELARRHGWWEGGPAGAGFVVLDRPGTSIPGVYEFVDAEVRAESAGPAARWAEFCLAGGFAAADFMVNHAHLTLHGLAGVAGCVKSLAMGCSSLAGKLRMHQSLLPAFDSDLCVACGACTESCPEQALSLPDGAPCPRVDPELCIGCGECQAVCPQSAVAVRAEEIADWQRGRRTFATRVADYALGLMEGRWDGVVHVLHMYTVTERCDCLNETQDVLVEKDMGFLVGKNPFALDLLAARMLAESIPAEEKQRVSHLLKGAETTAEYVRRSYGILPATPVHTIAV